MMRVELTIPGVAKAQPRQRHRHITTRDGRSFNQNYTPAKAPVNDFKATIRLAFAETYDGPPSEKPVILQIIAILPRPKGMIWKSKPMPRVPHIVKPDTENITKAVKDALTKLAYRDDSQVYYEIVQKFIASGDEQPHTRIVISST